MAHGLQGNDGKGGGGIEEVMGSNKLKKGLGLRTMDHDEGMKKKEIDSGEVIGLLVPVSLPVMHQHHADATVRIVWADDAKITGAGARVRCEG